MATNEHFGAACKTIAASRLTILLAKLFGKKVVGSDDWAGVRSTVTCYRWRGVLYMTNFKHEPLDASGRQEDSK